MIRNLDSADELAALPFFSCLDAEALRNLLPSVQLRTYAPRECIARAHEPADGLHVILSGRVTLLLEDGAGRQIIMAIRKAPDLFGEAGLFRPGATHIRAECCERTHCAFIPARVVFRLLDECPRLSQYLLGLLAERMAEAQRKISHLGLLDVHGRVASVLVEHAREQDGHMLVEVGSERIAVMVGASREMVSRVLKNMIGQGAVARVRRKLVLLDAEVLAARGAQTQPRDRLLGSGGRERALSSRHEAPPR